MKKLISILLLSAILLTFAACGEKQITKANADTIEAISVNEPGEKDYKYGHISLTIPDDFIAYSSETDGKLFVNKGYPEKSDCILFTESDFDKSRAPQTITTASLEKYYGSIYETDITTIHFEKKLLGELYCIIYKFSLSFNGESITQSQLFVYDEKSVNSVSFTSASGEYDTIFENALKSISIVK